MYYISNVDVTQHRPHPASLPSARSSIYPYPTSTSLLPSIYLVHLPSIRPSPGPLSTKNLPRPETVTPRQKLHRKSDYYFAITPATRIKSLHFQ
ncbi:hypothetical protein V495_08285 [Pseudogymnoascus sp. VKM F-4514 (FW-929)]|nr:hypothetical protein V495_08285 [Pseudogymnoascus sp. VKM F-4514 (FW-929)]KFY60802.1 hypothetical protein V497_03359 [Pseudogymnoascus sp. VKM F-4516 (FW-969)]